MEAGKLYLFANGEIYLIKSSLDLKFKELRNLYRDLTKESDYFKFYSFYTLTSSIIELSLNYICLLQCVNLYGFSDYKPFNEIFSNLRFKDKLLLYPSIFSSGKFSTDNEDPTIQVLSKFITDRNKLLHPKPILAKGESNIAPNEFNDFDSLFDAFKTRGINHLDFEFNFEEIKFFNISYPDCVKLAKALGVYKKDYYEIMTSEKIVATKLILKKK
ncbi:hypothetical protein [Sphingobacterium hotanense]|uniref:hypothetical protein n=1 Tax=Sphingobacterium hotanense TaxID=649196 RepID=UPI0011F1C49D|nr:hypothetical protein [Sphingobacterium hotanense]